MATADPAPPPPGRGTNRQLVLRRRPEGLLALDDVEAVTSPIPVPADGEAVFRVEWLSIDATVRSWLSAGEGYLPAVGLGEVVRCSTIGRVIASASPKFPEGSLVYGLSGWQQYGVARDDAFTTLLPEGADPPAVMAVYGATGVTAYVGMLEIGAVRAGETVVVSAAAGATGSLAAQIAKLHGCRVVGICGSDDKCDWLTGELGIDAAVNYRTDDVPARLRELCPDRVDVYFDNVGGPLLDMVLARLANGGRVVLCGAIAIYNEAHRPPGPANYVNLISRRGRMQGFLSLDYLDRFAEIGQQLGEWVAAGKLRYRVHVFEGLDAAPEALNAMFTGANTGKIVVKVA